MATRSSNNFQTDLSDIEKKLLLHYPGESKHLDDSQDHFVSDYYTQWDDPIYDQFSDYDYDEASVDVEEDISKDTFEIEKEAPKVTETVIDTSGEIRIDLHKYPQRLPRKFKSRQSCA